MIVFLSARCLPRCRRKYWKNQINKKLLFLGVGIVVARDAYFQKAVIESGHCNDRLFF